MFGKSARHASLKAVLTTASAGLAICFALAPNASAQLLTTPTPVTPSDSQFGTVAEATCVQQLDDLITGLEIAGTVTEGIGLGAEVGAALDPTGISEGIAVGVQVAGYAIWTSVFGLEQSMQDLDNPECDATFAGTVEVTAGGINVTGNSIFQNGLGIVGNSEIGGTLITGQSITVQSGGVDVTGDSTFTGNLALTGNQTIGGTLNVTGHTTLSSLTVTGNASFGGTLEAQSLVAHTGVAAYDGAIWLGVPNNGGFAPGIALGGGALSGAGTGGTAASATHTNAMALGNGASAGQSGSVAVGRNAVSSALDAVAFGTSASASGQAAIASGAGAQASGAGASAYGQLAMASGNQSFAAGAGAQATMQGAVAVGHNASATGVNAIAIGAGASAQGSIAIGAGASAANGGAAYGDGATATGVLSAALGPNSTAVAANSAAIGNGSVADQINTVSIGAPGAERRLVNLADGIFDTDGVNLGQLNTAVERLERGVASTLAQSTPMLPLDRGDTGVAVGAGYYRGEHALGLRLAHRFDTSADMMLSVGVASAGGDDSTTGQAGFSFRF